MLSFVYRFIIKLVVVYCCFVRFLRVCWLVLLFWAVSGDVLIVVTVLWIWLVCLVCFGCWAVCFAGLFDLLCLLFSYFFWLLVWCFRCALYFWLVVWFWTVGLVGFYGVCGLLFGWWLVCLLWFVILDCLQLFVVWCVWFVASLLYFDRLFGLVKLFCGTVYWLFCLCYVGLFDLPVGILFLDWLLIWYCSGLLFWLGVGRCWFCACSLIGGVYGLCGLVVVYCLIVWFGLLWCFDLIICKFEWVCLRCLFVCLFDLSLFGCLLFASSLFGVSYIYCFVWLLVDWLFWYCGFDVWFIVLLDCFILVGYVVCLLTCYWINSIVDGIVCFCDYY